MEGDGVCVPSMKSSTGGMAGLQWSQCGLEDVAPDTEAIALPVGTLAKTQRYPIGRKHYVTKEFRSNRIL